MPAKTRDPAKVSHFLDTSIARTALISTTGYREYLASEFGDSRLYVNDYVRMEFLRGLVVVLIDFYFSLRVPTVPSFDDAIKLWNERFEIRAIKSVSTLISELVATHRIESGPEGKTKVLAAIADYIFRLLCTFESRFFDTGQDPSRCPRGKIVLGGDGDITADVLFEFKESFGEVDRHRKACNVYGMLLKDYVQQVAKFNGSHEMKAAKEKDSIKRASVVLEKATETNGDSITCKQCGRLGDLIISLGAPGVMRIETSDKGQATICNSLQRPYKLHPSQSAVAKQAQATNHHSDGSLDAAAE